MTVVQFAENLLKWYGMYGSWNPVLRQTTTFLENIISSKANKQGFLEISDLVNIAVWGGNQHDIASKVLAQNTGAHVQIQTRQAIGDLNKGNWANALQELKGVNSWGFTYATKTLRFICPQKYPALDRLIRSQIKVLNLKRNDASYRQFTKLCQQIRQRCSQPGPRSGDAWWLADVDMALFAFSRNGNCLV